MAVSGASFFAVITGLTRDPAFLLGIAKEAGSRVKPGMTVKVIS